MTMPTMDPRSGSEFSHSIVTTVGVVVGIIIIIVAVAMYLMYRKRHRKSVSCGSSLDIELGTCDHSLGTITKNMRSGNLVEGETFTVN